MQFIAKLHQLLSGCLVKTFILRCKVLPLWLLDFISHLYEEILFSYQLLLGPDNVIFAWQAKATHKPTACASSWFLFIYLFIFFNV